MLPDWLKQIAAECTEEERASLRINPRGGMKMNVNRAKEPDRSEYRTDNMVVQWASKDGAWWVALPEPETGNSLYWQYERFSNKEDAILFGKASLSENKKT